MKEKFSNECKRRLTAGFLAFCFIFVSFPVQAYSDISSNDIFMQDGSGDNVDVQMEVDAGADMREEIDEDAEEPEVESENKVGPEAENKVELEAGNKVEPEAENKVELEAENGTKFEIGDVEIQPDPEEKAEDPEDSPALNEGIRGIEEVFPTAIQPLAEDDSDNQVILDGGDVAETPTEDKENIITDDYFIEPASYVLGTWINESIHVGPRGKYTQIRSIDPYTGEAGEWQDRLTVVNEEVMLLFELLTDAGAYTETMSEVLSLKSDTISPYISSMEEDIDPDTGDITVMIYLRDDLSGVDTTQVSLHQGENDIPFNLYEMENGYQLNFTRENHQGYTLKTKDIAGNEFNVVLDIQKELYDVSYEGGNDAKGTSPQIVKYWRYQQFSLPENHYTKKGYEFKGWEYGEKLYQPKDIFIMPKEDVTFTARWESAELEIEVKTKMFAVSYIGGDGAKGTEPQLAEYEQGEKFILMENLFEKEGFTFIGWEYGGKMYQPGDSFTMPNRNVAFTARWAIAEVISQQEPERKLDDVPKTGYGGNASVQELPTILMWIETKGRKVCSKKEKKD